ncbi:hypothetical protein LLB_1397 [Legionella longbeachae D-4968]|nr:hypothetical protein LLB_1397 [Legionella longbeachae D-4968]
MWRVGMNYSDRYQAGLVLADLLKDYSKKNRCHHFSAT